MLGEHSTAEFAMVDFLLTFPFHFLTAAALYYGRLLHTHPQTMEGKSCRKAECSFAKWNFQHIGSQHLA